MSKEKPKLTITIETSEPVDLRIVDSTAEAAEPPEKDAKRPRWLDTLPRWLQGLGAAGLFVLGLLAL